jgi:hypothetical protein
MSSNATLGADVEEEAEAALATRRLLICEPHGPSAQEVLVRHAASPGGAGACTGYNSTTAQQPVPIPGLCTFTPGFDHDHAGRDPINGTGKVREALDSSSLED